eukprot:3494979-Lingulodinium_polyedra.AAC.1
MAAAVGPDTARHRSSGMSPRAGGLPRCRRARRLLLPQLPPLLAVWRGDSNNSTHGPASPAQ